MRRVNRRQSTDSSALRQETNPYVFSKVALNYGDGDSAIVVDFTIQPPAKRQDNYLGEREDADARTFHVQTELEHSYSDVPWQRLAEIISPFIIRVMESKLESVRLEDNNPTSTVPKITDLFGVVNYDKEGDEDEEGFPFHGFALLTSSEDEPRSMITLEIIFFDKSENGARFTFEERL